MKNQIRKMFNSIYEEYDFINNLITFGLHKKWKKQIVKISKSLSPSKILDVATGTADIAIALTKITNCEIIGMDLSSNMLDMGNKKIKELNLHKSVKLEHGDVENLKYGDNVFDIVTVGYGVRNFENLKKSLDEIYRVLKKNGTLIILETSVPKNNIIKLFYNFFTKFYVKLIGLVFSKNFKAYSYLQKSASNFPHGKEFINILKNSKFTNTSQDIKLFGASTIYVATK
tara:strand:- start:597 stop:1283 length:687 start_codon:yes stop_codon:yes gene_type:complete